MNKQFLLEKFVGRKKKISSNCKRWKENSHKAGEKKWGTCWDSCRHWVKKNWSYSSEVESPGGFGWAGWTRRFGNKIIRVHCGMIQLTMGKGTFTLEWAPEDGGRRQKPFDSHLIAACYFLFSPSKYDWQKFSAPPPMKS
jgi:hypothetical protein